MPLATEIRSYVDQAQGTATEIVERAQARALGVAGKASETYGEYVAKGTGLIDNARTEVKSNLDEVNARVESAVSPVFAKVNDFRTALGDKTDDVLSDLLAKPRVSKALAKASKLATELNKTFQAKVLAPVKSLAGRKKAAPVAAAPVVAEPAPVAAAPGRKAPAKKAPAKRAPAKKAPAKAVAPVAEVVETAPVEAPAQA